MTHAQLEHLRRIDAHLASLLAIAEKRTPGEWEVDQSTTWDQARGIHPQIVQRNAYLTTEDAAFIASCAGNAEAGWKATRAVIKSYYDSGICREWQGYMQSAIEPILAAFPNI
jgi:hypothetical protein